MTYLELITALAAAERNHGIGALEPLSRAILHAIAAAAGAGGRMRMKDLDKLASFPTAQAHVQKLCDGGWIEKFTDPDDRRLILLRLTCKAQAAFDAMTVELNSAPNHIGRQSCASCIAEVRALALEDMERQGFVRAKGPA